MNLEEVRKFVEEADKGLVKKSLIVKKTEELYKALDDIKNEKSKILGSREKKSEKTNRELLKKTRDLEKMEEQIDNYITSLEIDKEEFKHFDKKVCFSNIRELIKHNSNVRIGQIENEAGLRAGYMSRLEKDNNMTEPSLEFVVTAARMLNVSIDTMVSIDITKLTDTEKYLSNFFDKIIQDTLSGKIKWNKEKAEELNNMEYLIDCDMKNPLFELEENYIIDGVNSYPDKTLKPIFRSHNFESSTCIKEDCFNFQMEDGMWVYIMSIVGLHQTSDMNRETAREIWMWSESSGKKYLLSNRDESPIATEVDRVFETIKERVSRPLISEDIIDSINRFMRN